MEMLTEEEDEPTEATGTMVSEDGVPIAAAGEENIALLEELDAEEAGKGKGKKGKKGKKDKKEKEEDPKAKAKAEEKARKKEEAAKAKAEKAAKAKAAKEEKAAKKAEKEAALGPIKKLPKKKVIMIFLVFVPILAALLVIGLAVPADMNLKEARSAYYEQDYDTAYTDLYGRKLSEDDQRIFDNSSCILQMRRWEKAYQTYSSIGMPREALDALISGVGCYDYLMNHYNTSDVQMQIDTSYNNIVNLLGQNYGVTPEYARKIIATKSDKDYTRYIDNIIFGTPKPGYDRDPMPSAGGESAPDMAEGEAPEEPAGDMPSPEDYQAPQEEGDLYYQATIDANGNVIPDAAPADQGGQVDNPDALVYQIYAN